MEGSVWRSTNYNTTEWHSHCFTVWKCSKSHTNAFDTNIANFVYYGIISNMGISMLVHFYHKDERYAKRTFSCKRVNFRTDKFNASNFLEPLVKLQEYFPLYHLSSPSYQFQVFLSFQKMFDDCNISMLKQDKFSCGSRIYRIGCGAQFRGGGTRLSFGKLPRKQWERQRCRLREFLRPFILVDLSTSELAVKSSKRT